MELSLEHNQFTSIQIDTPNGRNEHSAHCHAFERANRDTDGTGHAFVAAVLLGSVLRDQQFESLSIFNVALAPALMSLP